MIRVNRTLLHMIEDRYTGTVELRLHELIEQQIVCVISYNRNIPILLSIYDFSFIKCGPSSLELKTFLMFNMFYMLQSNIWIDTNLINCQMLIV